MIVSGTLWRDTAGNPIQAHGGCLLRHDHAWYWYGEDKASQTHCIDGHIYRTPVRGVHCYRSQDLLQWVDQGIVLGTHDDENHDLHPSGVVERPKVLHCPATGLFVMWLHIDNARYEMAACGVAVADNPAGPFTYLHGLRPLGHDSRDFTLFQDDDDSAWLVHSAQWNRTLHVVPLSDDYLRPQGSCARIMIDMHREAPAICKRNGLYHLFTSGCTGWSPNPLEHAAAESLTGPWHITGNPCRGPDAQTTFQSQPAFITPLPDAPDTHLFMADRWNRENLSDSRYVWLPLQWVDNQPRLEFRASWSLPGKTDTADRKRASK